MALTALSATPLLRRTSSAYRSAPSVRSTRASAAARRPVTAGPDLSGRPVSDPPRATGPNTVQTIDVPRFFLHRQNLDNPIHLQLALELPAGHSLPEAAIARFAHRFITEYPKSVMWETLNNELVGALLLKYPQVTGVKSSFQVGSSDLIPMLRSSIVEQHQHGPRQESFEFVEPRVQLAGLPGHVLDLRAKLAYQPGASSDTYPDYRLILDFAIAFLNANLKPGGNVDDALQALQPAMLKAFPVLASGDLELVPVRDVPGFATAATH
jgi:hypothetical protein